MGRESEGGKKDEREKGERKVGEKGRGKEGERTNKSVIEFGQPRLPMVVDDQNSMNHLSSPFV